MTIDRATQLQALRVLASVEGAFFDPQWLAEDIHLLAEAFPDPEEFAAATVSTGRALKSLVSDSVNAADLDYDLKGWKSYHYQHRRAQRAKADMRIIYKRENDQCLVMGFGHRHVPANVYRRLADNRAS